MMFWKLGIQLILSGIRTLAKEVRSLGVLPWRRNLDPTLSPSLLLFDCYEISNLILSHAFHHDVLPWHRYKNNGTNQSWNVTSDNMNQNKYFYLFHGILSPKQKKADYHKYDYSIATSSIALKFPGKKGGKIMENKYKNQKAEIKWSHLSGREERNWSTNAAHLFMHLLCDTHMTTCSPFTPQVLRAGTAAHLASSVPPSTSCFRFHMCEWLLPQPHLTSPPFCFL